MAENRERAERIEVRVDPAERDLLARVAESLGLSQSDVMRQALRDYAHSRGMTIAKRRA